MEYETVLIAKVPRLLRKDGKTEMAPVPWAEPYARFTLAFEAWAITVLLACASVEAARKLLRLDWSSANAIMARAVERGLERRRLDLLERLGLDEKSFLRGQSYVTILSDLDHGRVLEVAPGKDTAAAQQALGCLSAEVRTGVQAAACDLSKPLLKALAEELPEAKVVHDKYHLSALLGQAIEEVRREESKELAAEGDERLKRTRYQWLYSQENLPAKHALSFEALAQSNLKTSRAWLAKENFGGFWLQPDESSAAAFFQIWYGKARRSRLEPLKRVAKTFKIHLNGLLAYFTHRITNAVAEGLNSKIQALKHAARGFRGFDAYRARILFHCGKLDLLPFKTKT